MRNFSVLIKPSSSNCNLSCKYCFYHDVSCKRDVVSRGFMTLDTARNLISKVLEVTDGTANFMFQGGEPTLIGEQFFAEFVALVKSLNTKNIAINYMIQTNGTLISQRFCEIFRDNNFLVGVSLDGTKQLHDYMRGSDGVGEYTKVHRGIELLKEHGIEFNILTVVTKFVAQHYAAVYNNLKKENYKYLQFIPCLDDFGSGNQEFSLTAKDYGKFLVGIYQLWKQDYDKGIYTSVRLFDNIINRLNGSSSEMCVFNGFCSCQYVIEADGTVYPCDFYCVDGYEMGNINDKSYRELFESNGNMKFLTEGQVISSQCKSCQYFSLCRGGCKREYIDSDKSKSNLFCDSYKELFAKML